MSTIVVIACPPIPGHTNPLLPYAAYLRHQGGFEVHFIGGDAFAPAIMQTGSIFHQIEDSRVPDSQHQLPPTPERLIDKVKHAFIDTTAHRMRSLQGVLESLRAAHPTREVVILQEIMFMGVWPFLLDAPLPAGYSTFPTVITFNTAPLAVSSIDTAPFESGFPPDASPEGRARNVAMYAAGKPLQDDLVNYANAIYSQLGAKQKMTSMDDWCYLSGRLLQPCSPSIEYPRSDLSPVVTFIGGLSRKRNPIPIVLNLPGGLVSDKLSKKKRIVVVTQGTLVLDYTALIIPTICALADREDLLVIALLGVKGASLPDIEIPSNTKVFDYLAYDAILPYTDVFVLNGGYGGFMHAVMHAVPMEIAGAGPDKAEVASRGEWAGIAVNMKTDRPGVGDLRRAIDKVMESKQMKSRCLHIQKENEDLNTLQQVERVIRGQT
ncbi:hypothetical protein ASPZODRAFT_76622 [Penicilliopsis zonata CBS 506.65]|uniref:Rhodanese domain-containing protein n=1 Tax=Penicilliopsis zonata CBS 506.65 TaxID=1073090 RepID=A0A1L9S5Y2_9EURO|nr:hypothetical protein ASPZODRAFT_76622 [Penicilliopsis zonata CBS 506.65]OJJ42571.1 hypothetical protein ASPZODRAFT_76622 [Penicilliopsis zonata CBS 506.65]